MTTKVRLRDKDADQRRNSYNPRRKGMGRPPKYKDERLTDEQQAQVLQYRFLPLYWIRKFIRYKLSESEKDDVVQYAIAHGLVRAAQLFNPDLGNFATYASWWVKQAVQRWIALEIKWDRPKGEHGQMLSLDQLVEEAGDDVKESADYSDPSLPVYNQDFWERVRIALLPDHRMFTIFLWKYRDDMALQAIGDKLVPNVSKERVRQLLRVGHERLRKKLKYEEIKT